MLLTKKEKKKSNRDFDRESKLGLGGGYIYLLKLVGKHGESQKAFVFSIFEIL